MRRVRVRSGTIVRESEGDQEMRGDKRLRESQETRVRTEKGGHGPTRPIAVYSCRLHTTVGVCGTYLRRIADPCSLSEWRQLSRAMPSLLLGDANRERVEVRGAVATPGPCSLLTEDKLCACSLLLCPRCALLLLSSAPCPVQDRGSHSSSICGVKSEEKV